MMTDNESNLKNKIDKLEAERDNRHSRAVNAEKDRNSFKAKVSELEGMVAGLGEALSTSRHDDYCHPSENKHSADCLKRKKALADTAKTAKEHDAGVRGEVWEEAIAWMKKRFDFGKHGWEITEALTEFEAKAKEADALESKEKTK